jgi:hypothetical protein
MAYVYAIVVDDVVRYIGKGSAEGGQLSRFRDHMRAMRSFVRCMSEDLPLPKSNSTIRQQLAHEWLDGSVIKELIIADGLTDDEAFKREGCEIRKHGYEQLWNRPYLGPKPGFRHSSETRARQSAAQAGKSKSPEHRAAMRKLKVIEPEVQERLSIERRERMMRLSPEERHERAIKANQSMSLERHRERIAKSNETNSSRQAAKHQKIVDAIASADGGLSSADMRRMFGRTKQAMKSDLYLLSKLGKIERRGGYHDGRYYIRKTELKLVSN